MDEFTEKRLVPRTEFSGKCWCESAGTMMNVAMTNLSRNGVFLKTAIPFPIGHRAVLRWKLPDERQVEAQAEVVWCSNGESVMPGMGLRFVDFRSGAEELERFLEDDR